MLQGTLIPHSLPIVINQLGFCPLGKLRKKIKSPLSLSHMRKLLQKQRDPWWYKEFMRSDKENGSCAFWKCQRPRIFSLLRSWVHISYFNSVLYENPVFVWQLNWFEWENIIVHVSSYVFSWWVTSPKNRCCFRQTRALKKRTGPRARWSGSIWLLQSLRGSRSCWRPKMKRSSTLPGVMVGSVIVDAICGYDYINDLHWVVLDP